MVFVASLERVCEGRATYTLVTKKMPVLLNDLNYTSSFILLRIWKNLCPRVVRCFHRSGISPPCRPEQTSMAASDSNVYY